MLALVFSGSDRIAKKTTSAVSDALANRVTASSGNGVQISDRPAQKNRNKAAPAIGERRSLASFGPEPRSCATRPATMTMQAPTGRNT